MLAQRVHLPSLPSTDLQIVPWARFPQMQTIAGKAALSTNRVRIDCVLLAASASVGIEQRDQSRRGMFLLLDG